MAIAFDGTANANQDSVSSITFSHTVTSNTNGILIVGVAIDSTANRSVSGITYNTIALTKVRSDDEPTTTLHSEVWYLLAPATGAHNVVVTFPGTMDGAVCVSVSLTGVDQSTPVDAQAGSTSNVTVATDTVTVTTVADNSWVFDILCRNGAGGITATMVAHTNRTERANIADNTDGFVGAASTLGPKTPAGSTVMDWTNSSNRTYSMSAVSFDPAGAATPAFEDDSFYQFQPPSFDPIVSVW